MNKQTNLKLHESLCITMCNEYKGNAIKNIFFICIILHYTKMDKTTTSSLL